MNVSLQNIDKVSAQLTVKLEKADYQEKVDKSLKSFRQKAQMPGFRKGMVPMSLVKKMYGKSVIAEEVNKVLQEAVYNYIKENKVNMLGEPLPNEEKQHVNNVWTSVAGEIDCCEVRYDRKTEKLKLRIVEPPREKKAQPKVAPRKPARGPKL